MNTKFFLVVEKQGGGKREREAPHTCSLCKSSLHKHYYSKGICLGNLNTANFQKQNF